MVYCLPPPENHIIEALISSRTIMPNIIQFTFVLFTSIVLTACGGGSSPAANTAPKVTAISRTDAIDIMSTAKIDSIRELSDFLDFSNYSDRLAAATDSRTVTSTSNIIYATGGNLTISITKAKYAPGLSIGDTVKLTFKDVPHSQSGSTLNGSLTLSALSNTQVDISSVNSGAAIWKNYSLPFSLTFSPDFTQAVVANQVIRSGTIEYNAFAIDNNYLKTMSITSNNYETYVLLASGGSGTLTYSNLNAAMTARMYDSQSTLRPVTIASSYTLTARTNTDPIAKSFNVTNKVSVDVSQATLTVDAAKYKVSNFLGGTVSGTLVSPNVVIDVDEGGNGSIDSTFTVTWDSL
jgi:hypothetical protein